MAVEKETLNFEISKELYDLAKKESERLGIPLAGFLRLLLSQYFDGIHFERKQKIALVGGDGETNKDDGH